jgi:hypothetical protein
MSLFSRSLISLSLLLLVFSSGCHVSRLTVFPDFAAKKPNLGAVTLLSDCMLIQGLRGDTNKIDLPENKQLGVDLLNRSWERLREKGYNVSNTLLTSVGLLMNQRQPYRVAFTPDDLLIDDHNLPVAMPPFYLDRSLVANGNFQAALASLYATILNAGQKSDTSKLYIPSATIVGTAIGAKSIIVLLTGAMNIPITKGPSQWTKNPDKNEAVVAVNPISTASMMLYILDTGSGEVLWEDRVYKTGGTIYHDKITNMLSDILDDIP